LLDPERFGCEPVITKVCRADTKMRSRWVVFFAVCRSRVFMIIPGRMVL
jgi:hypothetical protein